ncbi:hypothetical protein D9M72_633180 [compost metagenome]
MLQDADGAQFEGVAGTVGHAASFAASHASTDSRDQAVTRQLILIAGGKDPSRDLRQIVAGDSGTIWRSSGRRT